jgi:hypothetical protein
LSKPRGEHQIGLPSRHAALGGLYSYLSRITVRSIDPRNIHLCMLIDAYVNSVKAEASELYPLACTLGLAELQVKSLGDFIHSMELAKPYQLAQSVGEYRAHRLVWHSSLLDQRFALSHLQPARFRSACCSTMITINAWISFIQRYSTWAVLFRLVRSRLVALDIQECCSPELSQSLYTPTSS